MKHEPRAISNPLYCETCDGRGYLVADAEWEPHAVQCADCKDRRPARSAGDPKSRDAKSPWELGYCRTCGAPPQRRTPGCQACDVAHEMGRIDPQKQDDSK